MKVGKDRIGRTMIPTSHAHSLGAARLDLASPLPVGTAGIDAGMTMTKVVRAASGGSIEMSARESASFTPEHADFDPSARIGATGAFVATFIRHPTVQAPEIEAAARGVIALRAIDRAATDDFVMALLGTGTAFALVREDGAKVTHLGGTALGGGSFAAIARRIDPSLSYDAMIGAAERGDRRRVDMMIADVYPHGIGRIGPDLTAAHLSKQGGNASDDDMLAALLNLHGENIAQIAASREIIAGIRRLVLCGGFAHNNAPLAASITSMATRFGVAVETVPAPGYAGALGAALIAAHATE